MPMTSDSGTETGWGYEIQLKVAVFKSSRNTTKHPWDQNKRLDIHPHCLPRRDDQR